MTTCAPTVPPRSGAAPVPPGHPKRARLLHEGAEIGMFLGAVALYFGVRGLTEGRPVTAHRNAALVLAAEKALSLDRTPGVWRVRAPVVAHPAVAARLHRRLRLVLTWPIDDLAALDAITPLARSGDLGVISNQDGVLREILRRRA